MPGVRPTTRSTRPNLADSPASRMSQPSASSKPAVKQSACTEAIVATGIASSLCTIWTRSSNSSAPSSCVLPANTCTSTPPVKTLPSARMTSARASLSRSAASIAATRSSINWAPKRLSGGSSSTTSPTSPSRSYLTLGTQFLRERRKLLVLGRLWVCGQAQAVVRVARDHVRVCVEDRLHRDRLGRLEDVDALGAEPVAHPLRDSLRGDVHRRQVLRLDVVDVARVLLRDHKHVPPRPRVDVHEGKRLVVFVDLVRGDLARDDLAEDAIGVCHERGRLQPVDVAEVPVERDAEEHH